MDPSGKSPRTLLQPKSPLRILLEDCFTIQPNDHLSFRGDAKALINFEQVVAEYPDFPFAYLGAAMIRRQLGDPQWKVLASKAAEIFERTTGLPDHHVSHDRCLKLARDLLAAPATLFEELQTSFGKSLL